MSLQQSFRGRHSLGRLFAHFVVRGFDTFKCDGASAAALDAGGLSTRTESIDAHVAFRHKPVAVELRRTEFACPGAISASQAPVAIDQDGAEFVVAIDCSSWAHRHAGSVSAVHARHRDILDGIGPLIVF